MINSIWWPCLDSGSKNAVIILFLTIVISDSSALFD